MQSLEDMKAYGIDVDSAMGRFLNQEGAYREFLKELREDTSVEDMVLALQKGNAKQAFDYAHRLKGVLGNLSLTKPYQLLSGIVETLRTGNLPSEDSMADFLKIYGEYLAYIEQI